jgi:capsule polysaccharide modification protein KpsS
LTAPEAPDFGCRNVLLLQGPNGPFFRRFGRALAQRGVRVTKINFHAGDVLFATGLDCLHFRGRAEEWPAFLERCIEERTIDGVFVFGDGRPPHRDAARVCERLGIAFFAFEEGYLRPDWITLERDGVNGFSRMPRQAAFYRDFARRHEAPREVEHIGPTFGTGALYATLLAIVATFGQPWFPHYRHHRSINCVGEMLRWVRGALRKYWFRFRERGTTALLTGPLKKRYFFVALQVHCDYQIRHSDFDSVEAFIEQVMRSFAQHARPDHSLVIKHHPMDRAYREYGALIRARARALGLERRVIYVHDLHLPTLLRSSLGSVMINSTVGIQSLEYGVPVKVLGNAIYDIPGLTFQGGLADFWRAPGHVDLDLYRAFRTYLLCVNQANGSFVRPLRHAAGAAGVRWFPGAERSVRSAREAS